MSFTDENNGGTHNAIHKANTPLEIPAGGGFLKKGLLSHSLHYLVHFYRTFGAENQALIGQDYKQFCLTACEFVEKNFIQAIGIIWYQYFTLSSLLRHKLNGARASSCNMFSTGL